ncbi:MAG: beta-ketoacyl-[acyl-carrier-protein] synthase family protein [Pseudomonadota bacterium]
METERVVITGLGTINAIAASVSEFHGALRKGVCGIGPVTVFDTKDFKTHTGGQVKGFAPQEMIPAKFSTKRMSRSDIMAMAAVLEALKQAGLFPVPDALLADTGVVIGGGAGGMLEGEEAYRQYLKDKGKGVRFSRFSSFCCASSADHIASKLRLMGPKTTFMTACSSGATAMGYARDLIRAGMAKVVIAGGTEPLSRITYATFNALGAVDPEFCKPFDKNRQGISLGEGAGILILESLSHARNRGAKIHAEILGYGVSCDAHHMTAPDPRASGAVRCMRTALQDAGVPPERVDYINAHGTATPANDRMETRGIKEVFGKKAYQLPVSSTKSMMGHTLGAAGAIEGVVAVIGIVQRFIPPTIHLTETDPECDLDYVVEGSRNSEVNIVLSNSFAFGGNNTSVIFGRFTEKGIVHE